MARGEKKEIWVQDIREVEGYYQLLYDLLGHRNKDQSISHGTMPTFDEHKKFVDIYPKSRGGRRAWYFIVSREHGPVGACYITPQAEIGVEIFPDHRRKGFGAWAVTEMIRRWKGQRFRFFDGREVPPGRFFANINPVNEVSLGMFKRLGFFPYQVTLGYDAQWHAPL